MIIEYKEFFLTQKYLKNLKHSSETMAKIRIQSDGSGEWCFSRTSVPLPRHWLMSFGRAQDQVCIDIFVTYSVYARKIDLTIEL